MLTGTLPWSHITRIHNICYWCFFFRESHTPQPNDIYDRVHCATYEMHFIGRLMMRFASVGRNTKDFSASASAPSVSAGLFKNPLSHLVRYVYDDAPSRYVMMILRYALIMPHGHDDVLRLFSMMSWRYSIPWSWFSCVLSNIHWNHRHKCRFLNSFHLYFKPWHQRFDTVIAISSVPCLLRSSSGTVIPHWITE